MTEGAVFRPTREEHLAEILREQGFTVVRAPSRLSSFGAEKDIVLISSGLPDGGGALREPVETENEIDLFLIPIARSDEVERRFLEALERSERVRGWASGSWDSNNNFFSSAGKPRDYVMVSVSVSR